MNKKELDIISEIIKKLEETENIIKLRLSNHFKDITKEEIKEALKDSETSDLEHLCKNVALEFEQYEICAAVTELIAEKNNKLTSKD